MSMRTALKLSWEGKSYTVVVTMEVIDRLESSINLGELVARCGAGDVRVSHASKLVALLLNEAGCEATQEDVYTGIYAGGDYDHKGLFVLLNVIFSAIFPEPKKSIDKSKEPEPKPKPKRKAATRGKRSTK